MGRARILRTVACWFSAAATVAGALVAVAGPASPSSPSGATAPTVVPTTDLSTTDLSTTDLSSWGGRDAAPAVRSAAGASSLLPSGAAAEVWDPPGALAAPLAQVWSHQESTYPDLYGFRNYAWDQLVANGGSLNYCVRWDSGVAVNAAQRDRIEAALRRQVGHWTQAMLQDGRGWDSWPYTQVPVTVVGWAVRDRALLQWSDDAVDVYVNDIREDAPQCAAPCGRFFHQDGDYSTCPGGAARHYDMSLWLTDGFQGGAGGDWGQRVGREYFMGAIDQEHIHIVEHELGHSFGLDDFYDWTPAGVGGFVMRAGSATQVTEFDRWMLRDWWRHLKSRYGY